MIVSGPNPVPPEPSPSSASVRVMSTVPESGTETVFVTTFTLSPPASKVTVSVLPAGAVKRKVTLPSLARSAGLMTLSPYSKSPGGVVTRVGAVSLIRK